MVSSSTRKLTRPDSTRSSSPLLFDQNTQDVPLIRLRHQDDTMSNTTTRSSSTTPTQRERKQSNPLTQFRSNTSLRSNTNNLHRHRQLNTRHRAQDHDHDDQDDDDDDDHSTTSGTKPFKPSTRAATTATTESDTEFDHAWTDAESRQDESIALLSADKNSKAQSKPSRQRSISNPFTSFSRKPSTTSRTVDLNNPWSSSSSTSKYPANVIRNQKYNFITFVPLVLYEQFKFFYNLYFLLVALSQLLPALRIGFLATYIVPLAFVLIVTIGKEAYDDYVRYLRDKSANSTRYLVLDQSSTSNANKLSNSHHFDQTHDQQHGSTLPPVRSVPSSQIKVGDLVYLEKNQRVPADLILLRTSDQSGSCFIRTDQLDGETDWKLRTSVESTQRLINDSELLKLKGSIFSESPSKDIHSFVGNLTLTDWPRYEQDVEQDEQTSTRLNQHDQECVEALTAENMLWSNTVLAAGSVVGFVIFTGRETRAVMNTSQPGTKVGLLDLEINRLAKILCCCTFALSVLLVALNGFRGQWSIYVFRFLILFSSIIPISLRVNLDMGKTVYSHQIMNDNEIPQTIVRTSTLPEELGRIEYLLSDKTGTLTQNEMELKKLHLGTMSYAIDSMDEVAHQLATALGTAESEARNVNTLATGVTLAARGRRDMSSRVKDVVLALGLCHNVTPAVDDDGSITYQASSPDEVAIVKWIESIGLTLTKRDRTSISLTTQSGQILNFKILEIFPFTSESKRMSIVILDEQTGEINFYQKGADVVMNKIVIYNDWLEEECSNMAREGLRTLVIAKKKLSQQHWNQFKQSLKESKILLNDRNYSIQKVISKFLEKDLELLGVTGVEDKLQDDVKMTIELLRNAGIKIWMLTGDKIETATCIAISTKLVSRGQYIHQIAKLQNLVDARDELEFLQTKLDCCLVIDGESLQIMIQHFKDDFIRLTTQLSTVVACRCSPTQKADVARLIRSFTKKRVCCIGDGGNDVSMIQAADVGVGIVGKEGRQASLAADFSINQFSYLTKLLVWHGRNSYKRSSKLAQFVIHRGLIISIIQAVFSSVFYFSPIAIYQGWLMVGYATAYTMLPVFSLVLDKDVNEDVALLYPELYKELTKGRSLSYKTFFSWLMISLYQGGTIMIASLVLFENEFLNIVSISFTALILNELIMVAVEVTTWHTFMMLAEVISISLYGLSILFLPEYFVLKGIKLTCGGSTITLIQDLSFVLSIPFVWKVSVIVAISAAPLWIIKILKNRLAPTQYAKLRDF
ncbi:putative aminophospholipid-translocase [Microbotryomycetes sp. JL221]|nr:putative aminophospholipid-translocase [Microbotryomycetes sp. JL221]